MVLSAQLLASVQGAAFAADCANEAEAAGWVRCCNAGCKSTLQAKRVVSVIQHGFGFEVVIEGPVSAC